MTRKMAGLVQYRSYVLYNRCDDFALQLAVYRAYGNWESNVSIFMVDTVCKRTSNGCLGSVLECDEDNLPAPDSERLARGVQAVLSSPRGKNLR
jgi:hypothetical protein